MGLMTSTWTHYCAVMIKTKAAMPDGIDILKLMMKMTFIKLVYQCGSNLCYNVSNIIYLVSLDMLTSSLNINLFTLYVLNTCYLYKIMADNSKCNPCTGDFLSDAIKCKIC